MSQNPEPIQISKSGHPTLYQLLLPFLYDILTKNKNMEQNGFSHPLMHRGRKQTCLSFGPVVFEQVGWFIW